MNSNDYLFNFKKMPLYSSTSGNDRDFVLTAIHENAYVLVFASETCIK